MPHGAVGIDDAAPRRDDAVRRHDARIDALFDADKAVNALVFDDLGKFFALFALDDEVAVDEAVADALGEQHARRALARGGHSDEYEVIHISHYNKNRKRKVTLLTILLLTLSMLFALTACSSYGSIKKAYEDAGYTESEEIQKYQDLILQEIGEDNEDYENFCTVHVFVKTLGVAVILEFHSTKKLEELAESSATFKGFYEDCQKSDLVKGNCILVLPLASDALSVFINA